MDAPSNQLENPNAVRRRYRADIDGLRAIAVIAVMLYHADLSLFGHQILPGGFLGVDVFFVISGYLITQLIFEDQNKGTFSLGYFYERRIRRIVPALLVVMLACIGPALWLMGADELRALGREMLSALFFVSNILFAFEDPYFAADAPLRLFLHSWSLGIEEQFYLIWPFILIGILRLHRPVVVMAALALMSLAAAQWASHYHPDQGFYLLPFRGWELLTGAILALYPKPQDPGRYPALAGYAALMCVIIPMVLFSSATPHPSVLTAIPVLATAALIRVEPSDRLIGRVMCSALMVWIGRISYSLYLWHFVLLVFARLAWGKDLRTDVTLVCLAASMALADLTVRFVEKPFRNKDRINPRALTILLGGATTLVTVLAALLAVRGGFTSVPTNIQTLMTQSERTVLRVDGTPCRDRPPQTACRFGQSDGRPIYLLGDSHGETLSAGLTEWATEQGRPLVLLIEAGCPVLFRYGMRPNYSVKRHPNCPRQSEAILDYLRTAELGTIIHFSYLSAYLGYEGAGPQSPAQPALMRDVDTDRDPLERPINLAVAAFSELSERGHKVVLVDSFPILREKPVDALTRGFSDRLDAPEADVLAVLPQLSRAAYKTQREQADAAFDRIETATNAVRIDPADWLCQGATCKTIIAGQLVHSDSNHPSPFGGKELARRITNAMEAEGF